jgi:hypothetical protein
MMNLALASLGMSSLLGVPVEEVRLVLLVVGLKKEELIRGAFFKSWSVEDETELSEEDEFEL